MRTGYEKALGKCQMAFPKKVPQSTHASRRTLHERKGFMIQIVWAKENTQKIYIYIYIHTHIYINIYISYSFFWENHHSDFHCKGSEKVCSK